jgi:glycosyltransferase involved in cell wall biosynthesis
VSNNFTDKILGIIIPAFNPHIENLKKLISRLKALELTYPIQILIVDDGSSIPVKKGDFYDDIQIRRHTINKGKGAALKTGFEYFLEHGGVFLIITLDADLQHPPEKIPEFIKAYELGKGQLIVGYRKRLLSIMPFHRIFSNMFTSLIISILTGQLIKDSQNGFRLIEMVIIKQLILTEEGFHMESEMLIKAGWQDFLIGHVPMPTIYSLEKSSINNVKDTINFIRLIFKLLAGRVLGCITIN